MTVGAVFFFFFNLLIKSWGTVSGSPQPLLFCRPPERTQGSMVPTMPKRGSHPGPPFDVGCAVSSESVRTSFCPGQASAARRPPGKGVGPALGAPPSWGPAWQRVGGSCPAPLSSALTRSQAWPPQGGEGSHCHADFPAVCPTSASGPLLLSPQPRTAPTLLRVESDLLALCERAST